MIYKDFCPYFKTNSDCINNNCVCLNKIQQEESWQDIASKDGDE